MKHYKRWRVGILRMCSIWKKCCFDKRILMLWVFMKYSILMLQPLLMNRFDCYWMRRLKILRINLKRKRRICLRKFLLWLLIILAYRNKFSNRWMSWHQMGKGIRKCLCRIVWKRYFRWKKILTNYGKHSKIIKGVRFSLQYLRIRDLKRESITKKSINSLLVKSFMSLNMLNIVQLLINNSAI